MSNIISFEDKKEDKELIELLEQFEKHMPTKEELEARINSIKDLYAFHYDIDDPDYLDRTQEVTKRSFSELVDAFHNYNPDSDFSKKQYLKRLRNFDTCRVFLSDYLEANFEISDEPITELDDLITDQYLHAIDDNRKQRSAEELKADKERLVLNFEAKASSFKPNSPKQAHSGSLDLRVLDIESYIPTVYRAYEIIFDMLKSKDSRCHSLDMYTLMLSNLEYYPFLDYKLACERNKEDQSK